MKHSPAPWKMDEQADKIWATDAKGAFPVFDIRGWGHLTGKGHGALGLNQTTALEIQKANGRVAAAAPELLSGLELVRSIIAEAAMTGFNCHDGDWAERLFASQAITFDAVKKAGGNTRAAVAIIEKLIDETEDAASAPV